MNVDPIKKLTINKGQTVKLVSQTMDAGINVEISYYDLNIHQSKGDYVKKQSPLFYALRIRNSVL